MAIFATDVKHTFIDIDRKKGTISEMVDAGEIAIYSDRIEIYNPGTFPEGFTPQDFINGTGKSIRRNPLLAQIMYYSKDIEGFGTGLRNIATECKAAGVRYGFELGKLGFSVIFYRLDTQADETGADSIDLHADLASIGQDTGQVTGQDNRAAILLEFCEEPMSRKEMQEHVGISSRGHFNKSLLLPLLESGQIEMTIPDKPNSRNQKYVAANTSKDR